MDSGGSPRDALGKLLPKTLSVKRRRRKEKKAAESNSSLGVDDDQRGRGRSLSPADSGKGSGSFVGSDDEADGGDDGASSFDARSKRSLGSLDSFQQQQQQQRRHSQQQVEDEIARDDGDEQR